MQRMTLIVDQKGVRARFYMGYLFDENDTIVLRRLFGADNRVLWSATSQALEPERDIYDAWIDCVLDCYEMYKRKPRRERKRLVVFCMGACDLMYPIPDESVSLLALTSGLNFRYDTGETSVHSEA